MPRTYKLSEEDKKFAKESNLSLIAIADVLKCSVGAVAYYRRIKDGIWSKKRIRRY